MESRVITLGIDLSASAKNTGVCRIDWRDNAAFIDIAECGADDVRLCELVAQADRVGIDVPLGWPDAFVEAVGRHQRHQLWPDVERDHLLLRETDRYVLKETRRRPLSVAADRIAVTAIRGASL